MTFDIHNIPHHSTNNEYREFMERVNPGTLLVMSLDHEYLSWAMQQVGDSGLLIIRHYPEEGETGPDGQFEKVKTDPEGYAENRAWWWNKTLMDIIERQRHRGLPELDLARVAVITINEFPVWTHEEELIRFEKKFLPLMHNFGLRACALNLGVGHPAELWDGKPDWRKYMVLEAPILAGNHLLALHEYWDNRGPGHNWGWWAGRFLKCPLQVPIVITECGIDMHVSDTSVPQNKRGWRGQVNASSFVAMMKNYHHRLLKSGWVVGMCCFTTDSNDDWWSFDTLLAHPEILDVQWAPFVYTRYQEPPVDPPNDPPIDPPPCPPDTKTDVLDRVFETLGWEEVHRMARAMNIEPRAAMAILDIETDLEGYKDMPIRFEAHIFRQLLGPDREDEFYRHFKIDGPKPWQGHYYAGNAGAWVPTHSHQGTEREAFKIAQRMDHELALQSVSMGIPQVMGFNYDILGYGSASYMYHAFSNRTHGVLNQIGGFFAYLGTVDGMVEAIQRKDWREVARMYNGPGNVDEYSKLLEDAYNAWK